MQYGEYTAPGGNDRAPFKKIARDINEDARNHARSLKGTPEFERSCSSCGTKASHRARSRSICNQRNPSPTLEVKGRRGNRCFDGALDDDSRSHPGGARGYERTFQLPEGIDDDVVGDVRASQNAAALLFDLGTVDSR